MNPRSCNKRRYGKAFVLGHYALSLAIPAIVVLAGLITLSIDPFGQHSLVISDGLNYIYGNEAIARMIREGESALYTFDGGGSNRWASLAWGGLYPTRLLALFQMIENAPTIFTWISVLNISLCGLTMYILLAYLKGHRFDNLIFSTSYALMGFNVVNCYQGLFFIGPQMLPLVALGLVKLLRGESPIVYILSFAFCTFCNFYFGFIVAVASIVMCLAYLYVFKDVEGRCKHPIRTYAVSSFIGGFLPALMWLPALKAYSGGGRLDQTGADEFLFSENMPFIQMFSKLFTGANSTSEIVDGMPNIFCGILVVALVILYFLNRQIDKRRKIAVGIVLVFYLVTFYVTAFTLVMHGGTHTNWFPYRYSFVFSFLLIGVAAEQFSFLYKISSNAAKQCGATIVISTLIVFSTQYEFISGAYVLLDLALILLMWGVFCLHKDNMRKVSKRAFSVCLLFLVSGNLYANYTLSIHSMQEWEMNSTSYAQQALVYGSLIDAVNSSDDTFFRMEKDNPYADSSSADAGLYDYNGVSASGPTIRMFVHKQLTRLGLSWFDMRHWYSSGIPEATDSLLGLKYFVSHRDLDKEKGYECFGGFEDVKIYKNDGVLNVAALVNEKASEIVLGDDVFQNLNDIWKTASGITDDIFLKEQDVNFSLRSVFDSKKASSSELKEDQSIYSMPSNSVSLALEDKESIGGMKKDHISGLEDDSNSTNARIVYEFTADRNGPVYIFNTGLPGSSNGSDKSQMKLIGIYDKGDVVTGEQEVTSTYLDDNQFKDFCSNIAIAYADGDVLSRAVQVLKQRDITFEVRDEANPHGAFTAEAGQRILFTIPWDEGWTCYIDEQEVPIDKTWDLFMSVEAPEGSHSYELRFFPAWMDYGIAISGAALLALVAYMAVWYHGNRKRRRAEVAITAESADCRDDEQVAPKSDPCEPAAVAEISTESAIAENANLADDSPGEESRKR